MTDGSALNVGVVLHDVRCSPASTAATPVPFTLVAALQSDLVTVWGLAVTRIIPSLVEELRGVLSAAERAIAARMPSADAEARYIAGHSMLRRLLAQEIGSDPSRLRIEGTPNGKPSIYVAGKPNLSFSLAHCPSYVVAAVSHHNEIGVDVEPLDRQVGYMKLMERYCTPTERSVINELPPEKRSAQFLRFWVVKEAMAKAAGLGLRMPFADIDAGVARHNVPVRLAVPDGRHIIALALQRYGRPEGEPGLHARWEQNRRFT